MQIVEAKSLVQEDWQGIDYSYNNGGLIVADLHNPLTSVLARYSRTAEARLSVLYFLLEMSSALSQMIILSLTESKAFKDLQHTILLWTLKYV